MNKIDLLLELIRLNKRYCGLLKHKHHKLNDGEFVFIFDGFSYKAGVLVDNYTDKFISDGSVNKVLRQGIEFYKKRIKELEGVEK